MPTHIKKKQQTANFSELQLNEKCILCFLLVTINLCWLVWTEIETFESYFSGKWAELIKNWLKTHCFLGYFKDPLK